MKVKKVKNISNFGQFSNFKWPDNLNEFNKYNFFYGWNYSGKTTLSRVFRCFELKQLHKDYTNASFELETDEGEKTKNDFNLDYPIRVFNEDFIVDNFDWNNEDADIEPLLILGKESIELEKKLQQKQKEKDDKEKQKSDIEKEKSQKENDIQQNLQNKASEIRNILSITNPRDFDRNNLEQAMEDIKNNYSKKILSDDELKKLVYLIHSQKLESIAFTTIELKLSRFINDVNEILTRTVSAQKIIEKLKQNPKLSQWVKEGIELHKGETACQFCGNILTTERIEELNKHFSTEFNSFIEGIKQKEEELNEHINLIDKYSLPDKARFYKEFQDDYEKLVTNFKLKKENYINTIQGLLRELARKKEKPFELLNIDQSINNNIEVEIFSLFKQIEDLVKKHNAKGNSLNNQKNEAKEKIKHHYCAKSIQEEKYFEKKQEIEKLGKVISELKNQISQLQDEIAKIEENIEASAIGAQRLNTYLRKFFSNDNLRVKKTQNGKYKLYRNNQIAKNLSTGERNIISLVYFYTKLEESNFDFGSAVIFIDDPVSSLDANHIHAVYAFLNEKIKNANQVFITTHNFDFFNLLKDIYRYGLQNQDGNFYLVKAITNEQNRCSTIEQLPDILFKFKSEYNYLFYILKKFDDTNDKNSFDQLYLLPNILRRFFEMYLFMRYPDGKKFKDKIETFFKNNTSNKKIKALKIMDEYSHEENIEHSLRFPDISELISTLRFILKAIEEQDQAHYDALKSSIS